HHDGYSYLLKKLLESLDSPNEQIQVNAKRYLLGLSSNPLNTDVLEQIKKQVLEACSSDETKTQLLMECISTNGNLIKGLDDIVYLRINKMFESIISTTKTADQHTYLRHPVQIVRSIISLDKAVVDKFFKDNVDDVLNKYKFSPLLMKIVKNKEWARAELINNIFEKAGSSTFDEANSFARSASVYDKDIAVIMNEIECF
ncbi:hypothetical protein DC742_25470, partial [Salmonella enterica subsp. enterica serovar Urbana]|nr:hypothetical protein [Salmonella enterica subsp. enterica serovar Urbana]